jgi:hypothetical protein
MLASSPARHNRMVDLAALTRVLAIKLITRSQLEPTNEGLKKP